MTKINEGLEDLRFMMKVFSGQWWLSGSGLLKVMSSAQLYLIAIVGPWAKHFIFSAWCSVWLSWILTAVPGKCKKKEMNCSVQTLGGKVDDRLCFYYHKEKVCLFILHVELLRWKLLSIIHQDHNNFGNILIFATPGLRYPGSCSWPSTICSQDAW